MNVLSPKGPPFTVARYGSLGAAITAQRDALRAALESLYALVQGEAPSLLEDDHHDQMVRNALDLCDHEPKLINDSIGDKNVINGTQQFSYWQCKKCGEEVDAPADADDGPDPDEARDRRDDRRHRWGQPDADQETMKLELLPAEQIALTMCIGRLKRGEELLPNTAKVAVMALARLDGRYDWTKEQSQTDGEP